MVITAIFSAKETERMFVRYIGIILLHFFSFLVNMLSRQHMDRSCQLRMPAIDNSEYEVTALVLPLEGAVEGLLLLASYFAEFPMRSFSKSIKI